MKIALQEFDVQQFRAEIAKMSDAELASLGRSFRNLCHPRVVALQGRMAQATSA
jgi:hypothetical protein